MKKIYYLSTCSTCKRIMNELKVDDSFDLQDIKTIKISPGQLEDMKQMAGSYEALFSRRSMQYRARGLHEKQLTENDYRDLILEEYTFLKRPVVILGDNIFIGNTKAEVEGAKKLLSIE